MARKTSYNPCDECPYGIDRRNGNGDDKMCKICEFEALQKENEKWQKRYEELDAGHSRLYKDFCKQRQMMEQYKAVLKQARAALGQTSYTEELIPSQWQYKNIVYSAIQAIDELEEG